jgi:7-cyano-7-deazaguanine synthase
MCAISGCSVVGPHVDAARLAEECHRLLVAGVERGSDAFGLVAIDRDGRERAWRGTEPPRLDDVRRVLTDDTATVLGVSRATPTTEWRPEQDASATQPFSSRRWSVVHNGTVANDRELWQHLALPATSLVDSAVLPHVFEAHGFADGLGLVHGSFALAAVDAAEPGVLHLARDFKPLAFARHRELPVVAFASTPEQLQPPPPAGTIDLDRPRVEQPPPYSRVTVLPGGPVITQPLTPPPAEHRALVVASGGLDSTVAAAVLIRQGWDVTLLHFHYGCRAQRAETEAVQAVARRLGCAVRYVPLDWLGRLGASTLTAGGEIAPAELGAESPQEWVPARNMLMIACACALADAEGYTDIALGTNLEEGGAYPDNTQGFIAAMDAAGQLGTLQRPRVTAPLGNLVKHQIVALGIEVDAPLERTWSCYADGPVHCGACGPCFMRRVAFEMNGLPDPVPFAAPLERLRPV